MLEKSPMFADLSNEHLTRLEAISKEIFIRKASILFSPGEPTRGFYAVLDGVIRIYRVSPQGKEITVEIADAGKSLAEASLFTNIYHCFAQALKDSRVCLIQKDSFLNMIQKDTQFAAAWIHILSHQVIQLHQRIEELSLKSPKARIASYILLLAEMQNTAFVRLPVYRKSIATLLGMTHETFYRTAKELENEGLVRFEGQRIKIVNRFLLEEQGE
jgi:CRP-like cAMP-binding protein